LQSCGKPTPASINERVANSIQVDRETEIQTAAKQLVALGTAMEAAKRFNAAPQMRASIKEPILALSGTAIRGAKYQECKVTIAGSTALVAASQEPLLRNAGLAAAK